ncbi:MULTISPECIES: flagellar assembly protein FliW [Caloramator]|uniref:Flagellar assembly factor FliW n=1 Tax=Caloramator proteoclasticus DSM 10124 TaxID=1121262 RepID=A0A1M4SVA9_9CLOT|nr:MULTISPECIES: flagellar assembly protein FliW [Caloramator]SHE36096.1 flagellar assembly factor FliW [Caloramator proteoclasticus DSM 10124]
MQISTKFFGDLNINNNDIINFEDGIPGLEEYKNYVILNIEDSNIKCLQNIDEKEICLLLINPWDYFKDYEIELSNEEINLLGINGYEDVLVFNVMTIRDDKITVNLLAPIVINVKNNKAKQVILNEKKYSIRQEIPCSF